MTQIKKIPALAGFQHADKTGGGTLDYGEFSTYMAKNYGLAPEQIQKLWQDNTDNTDDNDLAMSEEAFTSEGGAFDELMQIVSETAAAGHQGKGAFTYVTEQGGLTTEVTLVTDSEGNVIIGETTIHEIAGDSLDAVTATGCDAK